MKVRLTNTNKFFLIDEEEFDYISKRKWYLTKQGYIISNSPIIRLHRYILKLTNKNKVIVDHINKNKLDNRKENLRIVTKGQNAVNSKLPVTNTSGLKGVYKLKNRIKCWMAQISINNKSKFLGYFYNKLEASNAYKKALEKYFSI